MSLSCHTCHMESWGINVVNLCHHAPPPNFQETIASPRYWTSTVTFSAIIHVTQDLEVTLVWSHWCSLNTQLIVKSLAHVPCIPNFHVFHTTCYKNNFTQPTKFETYFYSNSMVHIYTTVFPQLFQQPQYTHPFIYTPRPVQKSVRKSIVPFRHIWRSSPYVM